MGTQLIFEILPPDENSVKVAARSRGRIPYPKQAAQIFEDLATQLRPKPKNNPGLADQHQDGMGPPSGSPRGGGDGEGGSSPQALGDEAGQDEALGVADSDGAKRGERDTRIRKAEGDDDQDEALLGPLGEGEAEDQTPQASSLEEELAQAYRQLESIGLVKKGTAASATQNMTLRRVAYVKAMESQEPEGASETEQQVTIRLLARKESEVAKQELRSARETFWSGKTAIPGTGRIMRELQEQEGVVFTSGEILGTLEAEPRRAGRAHYVGTPLSNPVMGLPKTPASQMHEPCFPPSNEDGTAINPYGVHPFYKPYNTGMTNILYTSGDSGMLTDTSFGDSFGSPSRKFQLARKPYEETSKTMLRT